MAVTFRLKALTSKRARVDIFGARNEAIQMANQLGHKVTKQMATYPPPKENSGYVRTQRLAFGWTSNVTAPPSGINLRIRNTVFYVTRVHGNEAGNNQWLIHEATGWQLVAPVLAQARVEWMNNLREIYAKHPILIWK